jgi:hypothetical protein
MNMHYYSGPVVQKCERFEFNSEGKALNQQPCGSLHVISYAMVITFILLLRKLA